MSTTEEANPAAASALGGPSSAEMEAAAALIQGAAPTVAASFEDANIIVVGHCATDSDIRPDTKNRKYTFENVDVGMQTETTLTVLYLNKIKDLTDGKRKILLNNAGITGEQQKNILENLGTAPSGGGRRRRKTSRKGMKKSKKSKNSRRRRR